MKQEEKIYRLMGETGVGSIVLGIVVLVTGIAAGVLMIINGGRLLAGKSDVLI